MGSLEHATTATLPLWFYIVIGVLVLMMVLGVCVILFLCFSSSKNKETEEKKKDAEKEEKKDVEKEEKKSDKPKASDKPKTSENPKSSAAGPPASPLPKSGSKLPKKPVSKVPKKSGSKLPKKSEPYDAWNAVALAPVIQLFKDEFHDTSLTARARLYSQDPDRGPIPSFFGLHLDPDVFFFPNENERYQFPFRIFNGTNQSLVYEIRSPYSYLEVASNKKFGRVPPGEIHDVGVLCRSPHPYVEGEFFVFVFYDVVSNAYFKPILPGELMVYAYEHPERKWSAVALFTVPERERHRHEPSDKDDHNKRLAVVNRHVNQEMLRRQLLLDEGFSTLHIITSDQIPETHKKPTIEIRVADVLAKSEGKKFSNTPIEKAKKKKKSSEEESENTTNNNSSSTVNSSKRKKSKR